MVSSIAAALHGFEVSDSGHTAYWSLLAAPCIGGC